MLFRSRERIWEKLEQSEVGQSILREDERERTARRAAAGKAIADRRAALIKALPVHDAAISKAQAEVDRIQALMDAARAKLQEAERARWLSVHDADHVTGQEMLTLRQLAPVELIEPFRNDLFGFTLGEDGRQHRLESFVVARIGPEPEQREGFRMDGGRGPMPDWLKWQERRRAAIDEHYQIFGAIRDEIESAAFLAQSNAAIAQRLDVLRAQLKGERTH